MYHIEEINQARIEKNLEQPGFYSQNLQIADYIASFSPLRQRIILYILKFKQCHWVKLKNESIALALGCSNKTVTRTTNQLHEDGFIIKHQQNKYSPNYYTVGVRVDHDAKRVLPVATVPQIRSYSSLLDSLFRNSRPFLTHMRVKGPRNSINFARKGVSLVSEFQKQWVLDHRNDPRIKDMLNNPRIKAALIHPAIEKITQLLSLDDREQLKLIPFHGEALEYLFSYVEPIVTGVRAFKVDDRMGWLISVLNTYCKTKDLTPDWKWYYDICEIINLDPTTIGEKRPLVIKATLPEKKSLYPAWKAPKELPVNERIQKLRSELQAHESNLDKNIGPSFMMGVLRRIILQTRQELEELEFQYNGACSEKQILSHQYNSHSMAACSA